MLASYGFMQWFFLAALVGLTAGAMGIGVYIVARLIQNPGR